LFEKLEIERKALGGQVFDILGEAFENTSLKDLLIEAIRYGDSPDTRAKLTKVIDGALDSTHLKSILERNALVDNAMSIESLYAIKDEMDRAEARKLQPHFIHAFFDLAFSRCGGEIRPREAHRFELPHVPATLRERDRRIASTRTPVLRSYNRVCFDKADMHVDGRPVADLIHPAHPLMAALLDMTIEDLRAKPRQGAILLDPADEGTEPHLLLMIDHSVTEGRVPVHGQCPGDCACLRDAATGMFCWRAPHLDLSR
jgi:hypothetical protein